MDDQAKYSAMINGTCLAIFVLILILVMFSGCGSVVHYGVTPPLPPVPHGIMDCHPQPDGALLCRNEE